MPTKSKKSLHRKNNDINSRKRIVINENDSNINFDAEKIDQNPVAGVEAISESPEFMDSMQQLKDKLNNREKFAKSDIGAGDVYKKNFFKSKPFLFVLGFLLGFLVFLLFCFLKKDSTNNSVDIQRLGDLNYVISLVSRHAVLPEKEVPQLAKVSNPETFTGQSAQIFAGSRNGDLVLFYIQSKRAYLYDPEFDKLINIVSIKQEKKS